MIWAGHVARMRGGELCTGYCRGNTKERDHLDDVGVGGIII